MLGIGKKFSFKWVPFGTDTFYTSALCDQYSLNHVGTMGALLEFLDTKAQNHPNHRLLATLEDSSQADYTSWHAIDKHNLNQIDAENLDDASGVNFEGGEPNRYCETKEDFPFRLKNLEKAAQTLRFHQLEKKHFWSLDHGNHPKTAKQHEHDEWGRREITTVNARPNNLFKQGTMRENIVFVVPVSEAYQSIAAFPNGYWADSYGPHELFCICRHFDEQYGLKLFGIGADTFGLRKSRPLETVTIEAVVKDVMSLYKSFEDDGENHEDFVFNRLCQHLQHNDFILQQFHTG